MSLANCNVALRLDLLYICIFDSITLINVIFNVVVTLTFRMSRKCTILEFTRVGQHRKYHFIDSLYTKVRYAWSLRVWSLSVWSVT